MSSNKKSTTSGTQPTAKKDRAGSEQGLRNAWMGVTTRQTAKNIRGSGGARKPLAVYVCLLFRPHTSSDFVMPTRIHSAGKIKKYCSHTRGKRDIPLGARNIYTQLLKPTPTTEFYSKQLILGQPRDSQVVLHPDLLVWHPLHFLAH